MPRFTTSDGLSLYYTDEGTGTPVLCLSGLTRNGRDFDYMASHLEGIRLIRMDYRGRGQSDWAEDFTTYNVPREAQDAVELLDHLGIAKAGVIGTSRGGLISLVLAATAKDRLLGVAFNDIGPVVEPVGLDVIKGYLGRNPTWKTMEEAVAERPTVMAGFANVPEERWRDEVEKLYTQTKDGLRITYDPKLRDATLPAFEAEAPEMWPVYDMLADLPVAVIRGANSDLLSHATFAEMGRRHPGAILAEVPDRGHIPFLDEAPALDALRNWIAAL